MTIEELQAENAELRRQIAEDREKGQDLTVKTIFKLSDEIKTLKAQLEEYEKKIKDGRLVELPCKVGDKVYIVWTDKRKLYISEAYYELSMLQPNGYEVYLTYVEAKKRLAEIKGEEQGQERLRNDNSAER